MDSMSLEGGLAEKPPSGVGAVRSGEIAVVGIVAAIVLFAFGFHEDGIPGFGEGARLSGSEGGYRSVDRVLQVIEPRG